MSFYSSYFDINTEEFFQNARQALNPFDNSVAVDAEDTTELYGFVWINATLIFLMFVSSTGSNLLALWLHSDDQNARYEYNFKLLISSITLFYGYTALAPSAFLAVKLYWMESKERLSLSALISIYSYANVFWIPTTVGNIVLAVFISTKKHPTLLSVLQWIFVAVSYLFSGSSIIWKLRPIIQRRLAEGNDQDSRKAKILVVAMALVHAAFAVMIRTCFFGIS